MLKSLCLLCAAVLLLGCTQVASVQSQTATNTLPVLRAVSGTDTINIKLASLQVEVQVVGNRAVTTLDLTFFNPLDRVLEGSLELPLADGQSVTRYALDIEGKMREGVPVEKAKARVAFENTVRRKIDPGLIEKTRGNHFRTRVYPLPARGTRRVIIGIEEVLAYNGEGYRYQLPLHSGGRVGRFSLKAEVSGATHKPELKGNELRGFSFSRSDRSYRGGVSEGNFALNQLFAFTIPVPKDGKPLVFTGNHKGATYFYATGLLAPQQRSRPQPASIGVLWDVSASAEKRSLKKELDLLQKCLAAWKDTRVVLIPFHIAPGKAEEFTTRNGGIKPLLERMESFEMDGGTQLGALDLKAYGVEEFFLFSEGLSTFGKKELPLPDVPVTTINSSPSADFSYLKYIARRTGGRFIDLNTTRPEAAAAALHQQPLQLIDVQATAGTIKELVSTADPVKGTYSVAGVLESPAATLAIRLGYDKNGVVESRSVAVNKAGAPGGAYTARVWASLKVEELDGQYEKNKAAITALGKEFSIVTRNTSLLVLDRVEDYVQHEITPPAELQKEYFALLKERQQEKKDEKAEAYSEAVAAMTNLKVWWNSKYSLNKVEEVPPTTQGWTVDNTVVAVDNGSVGMTTITADSLSEPPPPPPPVQETEGRREVTRFTPPQVVRNEELKLESALQGTVAGVSVTQVNQEGMRDDAMAEMVVVMGATRKVTSSSTIELSAWKADADYLQVLEVTPAKDRLRRYYTLRKQYHNQPSFFVDVVRLFYAGGQTEEALRILSNAVELKAEDAELLRLTAYQLLEMGQVDLAIETFKEVLAIREEEPHSYRDLALAYNEAGNYSAAVGLLYEVVLGTWDDRFDGIKAVALNELNAIISSRKGAVDCSAIDPVFIYSMPVDIRIVIGWNSNDSDMDLWVTDPEGEKCAYDHPHTTIGGKISDDMTGGYGPEEYTLKTAVDGEYVVEANLYGDSRQTLGGPTTITAELFTGFGTPAQKRQVINFRVTTDKEVVRIGSLRFGK